MVKLRRTNIRIVHKVANTVGRVMTTGINMANKSGSVLQSQDQPELDARYVYVGVHADGPTRVLCFSETRDEYTRGTSEESVALLTQKLKSLEERNRVRLRHHSLTGIPPMCVCLPFASKPIETRLKMRVEQATGSFCRFNTRKSMAQRLAHGPAIAVEVERCLQPWQAVCRWLCRMWTRNSGASTRSRTSTCHW